MTRPDLEKIEAHLRLAEGPDGDPSYANMSVITLRVWLDYTRELEKESKAFNQLRITAGVSYRELGDLLKIKPSELSHVFHGRKLWNEVEQNDPT